MRLVLTRNFFPLSAAQETRCPFMFPVAPRSESDSAFPGRVCRDALFSQPASDQRLNSVAVRKLLAIANHEK